jgi:hypothetical protein
MGTYLWLRYQLGIAAGTKLLRQEIQQIKHDPFPSRSFMPSPLLFLPWWHTWAAGSRSDGESPSQRFKSIDSPIKRVMTSTLRFLFFLDADWQDLATARGGRDLHGREARALGLMEKKLMMPLWSGEERTEWLGRDWFDRESVDVGPTQSTVAAITVAVMVKSWTMHNFLFRILNYTCE